MRSVIERARPAPEGHGIATILVDHLGMVGTMAFVCKCGVYCQLENMWALAAMHFDEHLNDARNGKFDEWAAARNKSLIEHDECGGCRLAEMNSRGPTIDIYVEHICEKYSPPPAANSLLSFDKKRTL